MEVVADGDFVGGVTLAVTLGVTVGVTAGGGTALVPEHPADTATTTEATATHAAARIR
jgi:hypothetical protein